MFCGNCGKQLPEGARFCGSCGAKVLDKPVVGSPAATTPTPAAPQKPANKKKTPLLLRLLIFVVIYGVCYLLGGGIARDFIGTPQATSVPSIILYTPAPAATVKPSTTFNIKAPEFNVNLPVASYSKVFSDNGITVTPASFPQMDYSAFAREGEEGIIEHFEIGSKGDKVIRMVETLYVPAHGMSAAEKEQGAKMMLEKLNTGGLKFVSTSCNTKGDYVSVTLSVKDLDKKKNVQSLSKLGLIQVSSGATSLSKSQTESNLLKTGYLKK